MTEHKLTKMSDGYTIEARSTGWLTVVWTITVEQSDLIVKCHTVSRPGGTNDGGLAVLFEDAETVRLEAL